MDKRKTGDVPYCFMKCTTLFAKVFRFVSEAAISPNKGCVSVPLSEKVHPPILIKTLISSLTDLILVVSWKRLVGVDESIATTS